MISQEKIKILTPLQKLPKNVGDLDKLIFAKGFENLPKVQSIAQSGHTGGCQFPKLPFNKYVEASSSSRAGGEVHIKMASHCYPLHSFARL